jgi:hypothetical protein
MGRERKGMKAEKEDHAACVISHSARSPKKLQPQAGLLSHLRLKFL